MAGRYTEVRFYLAGASIALLLVVWGAFAVHDQQKPAATAPQSQITGQAQPAPIQTPISRPPSSNQTNPSGGGTRSAQPTPKPTRAPQTRTRAS